MDIKNLKLVNMPIEVDLGIPYIRETELKKLGIYDDLSKREGLLKFWRNSEQIGVPYSKGLLHIPVSGNSPGHEIPSYRGEADWDSDEADEAIITVLRLFSPWYNDVIREANQEPVDAALDMLGGVGLVTGTVGIVIPLTADDIGLWNDLLDFESFVKGLKPEWIGLYPHSRKMGAQGFTLRRFKPEVFDLRNFVVTPEALQQKRRGMFFAGYAPGLSEPVDSQAVKRCQIIPVPFSSAFPNEVANSETLIRDKATRMKTGRSKPDIGFASMLYSCPSARGTEWDKKIPHVWSKLYPRRFADFSGFLHPKAIARCNASLLYPSAWPDGSQPSQMKASSALPKIMRFYCPHYFIAPTMMDAILQTKFPEGIKPSEAPLPVPAFIIGLPDKEGKLLGVDGSPLQYILVAHITSGESTSDLSEILRLADPNADSQTIDSFIKSNIPTPPEDHLVMIGVSSNGPQLYELEATWSMDREITEESVLKEFEARPTFMAAASFKLIQFVANCLLYFNSVPQYLETAKIHNSVRSKTSNPQKSATDYWLPNIYGKNFSLPKEPDEMTNAESHRESRKPRPHLRGAHWRRQWHGPGLTQLKWIHIDFSWVNSEEP